jgi:DNA (cytosine-5)-methyltransferase 1
MIANHYSSALSDLDIEMVRTIPPGGNWKNIPMSIPSKRLEQIRASFRRGEGSRSTYYGRLRPDAPAYTINTYFGRPGNGCHIHPAQDRVLSHREAARLQSFPDSFHFQGSKAKAAVQIGNAVPPLLAYQVALQFGEPGCFVDLFAGAGGLSLGFVWAGWTPLVANDLEPRFLETYAANVHRAVVPGDIRDAEVRHDLVETAREARRQTSDGPFLVLGGPPCQGFSTAGNRRSVHDERNHLFLDYRAVVESLEPDGFVFENVTGLLNMEGGRVFHEVRAILGEAVDELVLWQVGAEDYGVPQRRSRVMLIGRRTGEVLPAPEPVTAFPLDAAARTGRPLATSVSEAIDDLPPLGPGEDATSCDYVSDARCEYQKLMRGEIDAGQFISKLRSACVSPPDDPQLTLEVRSL